MKKKYRAWVECISYLYLDVEAESKDEVWDIAEQTDGGLFEDSGDASWEIYKIEEVDS